MAPNDFLLMKWITVSVSNLLGGEEAIGRFGVVGTAKQRQIDAVVVQGILVHVVVFVEWGTAEDTGKSTKLAELALNRIWN
jgi:hypothetical protein